MTNHNLKSFAFLTAAGVACVCLASDPLANWHIRQPPTSSTTEEFEGVAYGNGRWVIVGGKGALLSSADGVQWTPEVNPVPASAASYSDVAFGNGQFIALGARGEALLTSTDGRNWTHPVVTAGGGYEIIHDGTRFIILAPGGYIWTTKDGTKKEDEFSVPNRYVDVGGIASGNGVFVEIGYKRTNQPTDLYSSTDLTHWENRDPKSNENMMNVGFGLGLFVGVGMKGTVITSPNGADWTLRPVPHSGFIWDVCVGGPYLVAAAQWGRLLTSTNGVDWAKRETGLDWHLTDVAYGGGTFVAVGWDGAIVQSDAIETVPVGSNITLLEPKQTGSQFGFKFTGQVGQTYQVQATTDLVHWAPLASVVCNQTPMPWSDPNSVAMRQYRVVKP